MSETFNADLPARVSDDWRQALATTNEPGQGTASYAPPGGTPFHFILEDEELSFGQSVETTEYPFQGGWSNRSLNETPQALSITGVLRGEKILERRNDLVEALRIPTDDEAPGYLELALWGRFPVVVLSRRCPTRFRPRVRSGFP